MTIKQTDIRREAVPVVTGWGEDSLRIAREAEEVLGYSTLSQRQAKTDEMPVLARALAELGIEILNKADVEKYKHEKQTEVARQKFEEWISQPDRSNSFFSPNWNQQDIGKYRKPIPEYVLNKAIQVKKAMPDVIIRVEHLEENPDPFLVVGTKHPDYQCLMAEEYYIEVWEEPKFEGR